MNQDTKLRVAVCLPQVPFERGGAEILADDLVAALNRKGHEATLVTLPFKWYPDLTLLEHTLAWRMIDLTESNGRPIDLVIATKFPSYLIRHPRKVVWLVHQFRQAYDLHGTQFAQFDDEPRGVAMRETIREMDATALGEAERIFTISRNVSERLDRYNGLTASPLLPPPQTLDVHAGEDDGSLLVVGRLDATKRVDLILRALALVPEVRLTIVGEGNARGALEALVRELGLGDRVTLTGRVDSDELARRYGTCRAVVYAPLDEDYGFVPIEAHQAGRPVITTSDAGGPLDVIADGETGFVCEPTAESIAEAIRRLTADPRESARMGALGKERAAGYSWDAVVETLTAPAP
jgi:glycosyltransferase involved in cell wall biosynthesis